MQNLRTGFVREAVTDLEKIKTRLMRQAESPESVEFFSFLRETARVLHSIKGSAATFGFREESRLTHEIENLLELLKQPGAHDTETIRLFSDALTELADAFSALAAGGNPEVSAGRNTHFSGPVFLRIRARLGAAMAAAGSDPAASPAAVLPVEAFERLSLQERRAVAEARQNGRAIFILDAALATESFTADFTALRAKLGRGGEVIATFPANSNSSAEKIFLRLLYAAPENAEGLVGAIRENELRISWQSPAGSAATSECETTVAEFAARAVPAAREAARECGKEVTFKIASNEHLLPKPISRLFDNCLIHLARNAVAHGLEYPAERLAAGKPEAGLIAIALTKHEREYKLSFSDDGRGLDRAAIAAAAQAANLPSENPKSLTDTDLLHLIFQPQISTAAHLTEISGRGIGLDAVKSVVEAAGGSITVDSKPGQGTTFSISIPHNAE
jgi:chemotaxis protein histidine kinase CheA